jgi:hypothetical protein
VVARRSGGVIAALVALLARAAAAQTDITLTLTQTPNVFPAPTVADYDAGFVYSPTGILFTVDLVAGGGQKRTTSVTLRSTSATLGGTKPIGDLQWRRADLPTWTPMGVTDAIPPVETRPVKANPPQNDPWSNEVFLRIKLNWATDTLPTYTAPIVFTLTVTTP